MKNTALTTIIKRSQKAQDGLLAVVFKSTWSKTWWIEQICYNYYIHYFCDIPILDYCASVWGFIHFQAADNEQDRAIRYFLGVHRFTPTLALFGETR
jgi:hypothetical protein